MKILMMILILSMFSSCGKIKKDLRGDTGIQGLTGQTGSPAEACVVTSVAPSVSAPNGGSLITCPASSSLVLNGTNGSNGAPGTPGTVISSKKLCPGNTVYPSTFIEVAFCMNNKLYGVYSANGGFMTELPPGTYGSAGVNSSCNFVIQANCVVNN